MNFLKSLFHIIKLVIFFILLTCLVVFMINNHEVVVIHLLPLPYDIEIRIFLVMILVFLCGMLFGFLLCSKNLLSKIISNFKQRRQIKKLEKKVAKNQSKII